MAFFYEATTFLDPTQSGWDGAQIMQGKGPAFSNEQQDQGIVGKKIKVYQCPPWWTWGKSMYVVYSVFFIFVRRFYVYIYHFLLLYIAISYSTYTYCIQYVLYIVCVPITFDAHNIDWSR